MAKYKCPYCDEFETNSFPALGRHIQAIHHLRITKEIYNKLMSKDKTSQPIQKEVPVEAEEPMEQEVPVKVKESIPEEIPEETLEKTLEETSEKTLEQSAQDTEKPSWFGHHTI